jgi:nucleolar complex protein 3
LSIQKTGKKAKLNHDQSKKATKGKDHAFQRPFIPIPAGIEEEDIELSDQDLDLVDDLGAGPKFLTNLDAAAIAK